MDQKAKTEELMIRYLLGRLSEAERAQVEQEFFANDDYFEHLLAVEDVLIDKYLLDELSPVDRQAVEALLRSSPIQWQEMELARDLMHDVSKTTSPKRSSETSSDSNWKAKWLLTVAAPLRAQVRTIAWLALSAFSIALLAWNFYLLPHKRQAESELADARQANQEMQRQIIEEQKRSQTLTDELEAEKAKRQKAEQLIAKLQPPPREAGSTLAQLELSPDVMSRGPGGLKVVNIPAGMDKVQISLTIKEGAAYRQYGVTIKSFEGQEVWPSHLLDPRHLRRGRLVLLVPADIFSKDDYTLTLSGVSGGRPPIEIADYSFRVIR